MLIKPLTLLIWFVFAPVGLACRVLFQDTTDCVYLYNAVRGELMQPPDFTGDLAAAVWDTTDRGVVAAVNSAGTLGGGRGGGWAVVIGSGMQCGLG